MVPTNERLSVEALQSIPIKHGAHPSREAGMCAMEAVAYLAGEPHTDHPQCASPFISAVMRSLNDRLKSDEEREILKPLLPKLIGSRVSDEVERRRAYACADWAVRENLPLYLELVDELKPFAAEVRAIRRRRLRRLRSGRLSTFSPPALRARQSLAAFRWERIKALVALIEKLIDIREAA